MDEMNKKWIGKQSLAIDNTEFSVQAKTALKENIDLEMQQLSDSENMVNFYSIINFIQNR